MPLMRKLRLRTLIWKILNEFEDMSLQEIADKEGENIKTIISRKMYAVKHLRESLNAIYYEYFNS